MFVACLRLPTVVQVVVAALLLAGGEVRAEEEEFEFGRIAQQMVVALEKYHLSHKKLDDVLATAWQRKFVERMDSRRFYFRQTDLDEFEPFATRLDEMTRARDVSFAPLVRERHRQRMAEGVKLAAELIDAEHDFAIDDEARDAPGYARDEAELRERWRRRIKFELLAEKANGHSLDEVRRMLHKRYQRVARDARELSDEDLCEIYLGTLCLVYDPHTAYLTPSVIESFEQ